MTIDEFSVADLRAGTVLSAERVEGSEKLLKLQVDLGEKGEDGSPVSRQILSGIGKHYQPEDLVQRQVVVIANLDPRMLMGLESRGMVLAGTDAEGKVRLLSLDGPVSPGTKIT